MTSEDDTTQGRRLPRVGPAGRPPCAVNDDGAPPAPLRRSRSYSERCAELMRDDATR